jgi:hypothetical protein
VRRLEVSTHRSSPANISTTIDDGARGRRLQFEFSLPAAATGDFALPLTLIPSMALGAPLHVDSPVDAGLLERQARIQARLAEWSSSFAPVQVEAPERPPPEQAPDGTGAFFSGGVDSFCTLLTHRDAITHLIVIHGFDVPLSDRDTRARIADMTRGVGEALGVEVIEVATDAKPQMLPLVPWQWYHGGLLAAIAHALEEHLARVLIPATHDLRHPIPWGQHPELDHLWSTARVSLETSDAELTRPEKCVIVGESDVAMRWLRTCWERPEAWNCGQCVKCLRTMIDLAACDRLAECRTFPDAIDVNAVRALVIRPESLVFCRDTVEAARQNDRCGELADALEFAMRRSTYRVARKRLGRIPAGVADRARRRTDRMRMRLGRSRPG